MADYPKTDHLQVDKITIERTNGLPVERSKKICLDVADADAHLRKMAIWAPASESGSDEYTITIQFSDGQVFQMFVGLRHDHTLTGVNIASTMRWTCEVYTEVEKPTGLNDKGLKTLAHTTPEDRAQYGQWLTNYLPVVEQDCQPLKTIERAFKTYAGEKK